MNLSLLLPKLKRFHAEKMSDENLIPITIEYFEKSVKRVYMDGRRAQYIGGPNAMNLSGITLKNHIVAYAIFF